MEEGARLEEAVGRRTIALPYAERASPAKEGRNQEERQRVVVASPPPSLILFLLALVDFRRLQRPLQTELRRELALATRCRHPVLHQVAASFHACQRPRPGSPSQLITACNKLTYFGEGVVVNFELCDLEKLIVLNISIKQSSQHFGPNLRYG